MKDREDCMFSSISITVRYYLVSREKKKTGRLYFSSFQMRSVRTVIGKTDAEIILQSLLKT